MKIRQMTVADVPVVHAMGVQEEGFKVSESRTGFWAQEQLTRWVQANQDVLLVAEIDGRIVGFILTTLHRSTGKATWENQCVLPECRGQGVAKELANEMVKRLAWSGATYIHFLVKTDNPFLVHYENIGFERGHDFVWFGMSLE